jgi:RNA polymerase sigma-70 factor (ECF subfamily)
LHEIITSSIHPSEDAILLQDLQRGAPQAFERLLDQYQQPVYRFVCGLLEDPADAPDVTQEVFVKVFRKVGEFRGDASLKTWIYRIAINEASNRRRWFARHRKNEVSVDTAAEGAAADADWFIDRRGTPFDLLSRAEVRIAIGKTLGEIDQRLRVAVILRDIEGLSYNEIADTIQVSLGTVKSRILRGREAMKSKLRRELAVELPGAYVAQPE